MRRRTNKYYFSVEGQTEKLYLEWLQNQIHYTDNLTRDVSFCIRVQKDPCKMVKSIFFSSNCSNKTKIIHLFDFESEQPIHTNEFRATLQQMKKAEKLKRGIEYCLGYSNFTFELWMILHKRDCFATLTHRGQYLKEINQVFGEHFQDLNEYKEEGNFKKILSKITLNDVKEAVRRSNIIMSQKQHECVPKEYGKYRYFVENPSLSIGEHIEKILQECGC